MKRSKRQPSTLITDAKGTVAPTGLATPYELREYVIAGTVKEFALASSALKSTRP